MRRVLDLSGTWRFMPDQRETGVREGWSEPGFDDRRWLAAPVPQAWDAYGPAFRGYEGEAWLRRSFAWTGRRPRVAALRFAGAGHHADVWLNGWPVGSHDGGYVPFALDVRRALRPGRNHLAVRIRHVFSDRTIPLRDTDWWKYGGITRPVDLTTSETPAIVRATVVTLGNPDSPLILVTGRIAGAAPGLRVATQVRAPGRAPVRSGARPVGRSGAFSLSLGGRGLPLWSPDRPRLVMLTVNLLDRAGRLLDRETRRFGVRTLSWHGGTLRLNGQPIWLRGVNQVEEYADWTCSPSRGTIRARILELKRKLHANFFRAAHYPHHPDFYALCDELGLLTACEIPLCYQPEHAGTTAAGSAMLDETFWAYGHHPSVIWWSTGNERPVESPAVVRGITRLIAHAKRLDPSRPVTCVSNRGLSDRSLPAHDVLVLNSYLGVWGGTTPATTAGLTRLGPELKRWLDAVHRAYPHKPLVIGEFGAPGFPVPGDAFGGERFQAEIFRRQLPVLAAHPHVSGCAAWCLVDQRMGSYGRYPVGYLGTGQLEVFGLKALDGRLKPAWRVVSNWYRRLARSHGVN